jgi:hypothetical protein
LGYHQFDEFWRNQNLSLNQKKPKKTPIAGMKDHFIYPSRHGLLTPTGRRKQWSDGPIKLAPLKEEKML